MNRNEDDNTACFAIGLIAGIIIASGLFTLSGSFWKESVLCSIYEKKQVIIKHPDGTYYLSNVSEQK